LRGRGLDTCVTRPLRARYLYWFLRYRLELRRQVAISNLVGLEVEDVDTDAVFHFAFAEIMHARSPLPVLL
jgi:hypothetical protein